MRDLKSFARQIEELDSEENLRFLFLEAGMDVYARLNGYAGYAGVMIKSPAYIALKAKERNSQNYIKASYQCQKLLKKAFELGLGSCWIETKKVPEDIKENTLGDKDINYIIAIGYADKKSKEKVQYVSSKKTADHHGGQEVKKSSTSGSRIPLDQLVYIDKWGELASVDELQNRGLEDLFFYVRNAPSSRNIQPWRFLIDKGIIKLGILNPDSIESLMDAGIMMFFFEGLANEYGIKGSWKIEIGEKESFKTQDYKIVAKYE